MDQRLFVSDDGPMAGRFTSGDSVQTPFGKGVVREVRNHDRLLVDVQGRALLVRSTDVAPVVAGRPRAPSPRPRLTRPATAGREEQRARTTATEIDLHGLTIEEALARAEDALNDALLADVAELRLIHGRSGGRIRAALHRRLRDIPTVCGFRLDPRNEGVTIVKL